MLRLEKVATPATAATVVVPERVPAPGLVPIATVTLPLNEGTGLLKGSRAETSTAGVMIAPATMDDGCPVRTSWLAPAGATVTVAVWVTATPFTVAERVLPSATVALKVATAVPLVFVVVTAGLSVFPVPVAAKVTGAPAITLPSASRAVTVRVAVLLPLLAVRVVGVATSVDCDADTGPAMMSKAALGAFTRPVAAASRVYPVPLLSMLRVLKVATPAAAVTCVVPVSVPP